MTENPEKRTLLPGSIPELIRILISHDIPVEKYGIGNTLPLQALLEQIQEGRSVLRESHGQLVRDIRVVAINVYYQDGARLLRLHEDRQIRLDHDSQNEIKEKKSRRRIEWSVARKIRQDDDLIEKGILTLSQELGIEVANKRLLKSGYRVTYNRSNKFPKLKNHMRVYEYDLFLRKDEFKKDGYSFKDKYLKSYFYWKEAE